MENSFYEILLNESQIVFIDKCKKEGKLGCSLTINNCQIYISFYNPEPSVAK